jgi:hypothetical protein
MKSKCKTCGRNCENGEYCFQHKSRKALANNGKGLSKTRKFDDDDAYVMRMQEFFLDIWKKRRHNSEISGVYLGNEPMSTYFHHILAKEKHPNAKYDEQNIILLTLDEHTNVESDMYKYEEVNIRREQLKEKYERAQERV